MIVLLPPVDVSLLHNNAVWNGQTCGLGSSADVNTKCRKETKKCNGYSNTVPVTGEQSAHNNNAILMVVQGRMYSAIY